MLSKYYSQITFAFYPPQIFEQVMLQGTNPGGVGEGLHSLCYNLYREGFRYIKVWGIQELKYMTQ